MMKPRSSRVISEQAISGRNKSETLTNGPTNNQQTSAQAIRKRRSSINVYDQPSSLNSRLRQLETDMLRLDEDRSKLFDDTHSVLAQYELKLNEIHAILKSRQDNVEKYVEDMKLLLQAKEEFEKQTKLLNEKNDRIHEKFMHRETTISREIKLLKNKFELLEKNREFRFILQKSNNSQLNSSDINEDPLISGLDSSSEYQRSSVGASDLNSLEMNKMGGSGQLQQQQHSRSSTKSVRIKLTKFESFSKFLIPLFSIRRPGKVRKKSNRVSSLAENKSGDNQADFTNSEIQEAVTAAATSEMLDMKKTTRMRKKSGGLFGRLFR